MMKINNLTTVFALILSTILGNISNIQADTMGSKTDGSIWHDSAGNVGFEMIPVAATVDYPLSGIVRPGVHKIHAKLRSGMLLEQPDSAFRGNILYFQGLGDSMLNHMPLFNKLSQAGYRVIAFDYFGQGRSEGSMNDTRIWDIPKIGMQIYQKFARREGNWTKPTIIGWSTGGLAAYYAAYLGLPSKVILIAPGIVPHLIVGTQDPLHLKFNQITTSSLTTDKYGTNNPDPHFDAIKPDSPLKVKDFALDLIHTSYLSRKWMISSDIRGFVLLSGENDTYVNAEKTGMVIKSNAPHFSVIQYGGALHEIDNEFLGMRTLVHSDILRFLE